MSVSSVGGMTAAWPSQTQRPPRPDGAGPMEPAAKALGMSTDDLKQALSAGKTLADVASEKGISKDSLVSAIAQDLKAHAPEGAAALEDAQATEMATNMVEGKRGPGGPPPGPPPVSASFSAAVDGTKAQQNLQSLASSLGIDPDQLLSQLLASGGRSSSSQSSSYGTSNNASGSGLLVDRYA